MLRQATLDQFMEKGRERYYQIRPILKKSYNAGEVVLIEPVSGDYFVGATTIEAYQKAIKKHPGKEFFSALVGRSAFYLKITV